MIVPVTGENLREAAEVYAHGWRASHEAFCTQEFLSQHTDLYQMQYLEEELQKGKRFFLLHMPEPVGIVSVHGPMLEHLYVLPRAQGQGAYMLWVLDNNRRAIAWYESWGFAFTGRANWLSPTLRELEMARRGRHAVLGADGKGKNV